MKTSALRSDALCALALLILALPAPAEEPRARIRDLGVEPGVLPPGPLNAITDVEGVRVGHRTQVRGKAAGFLQAHELGEIEDRHGE